KLISEDRNNNTAKNKYTTSIEIIPLNKYDLIYIDNSYAKKRNIHQIAVVISISTYIKIVDVIDNKIICISKMEYMANKDNIKVLLSAKYLSKYIITEIEEDRYGYQNKKDNDKTNVSVKNIYLTKDYDKTYHSKTYLPFIYESDEILCYDLENYKVPELEEYKENDNKDIYDVIPVRRVLRDMEHIKHLKKIYNKKKITDIEHKYFIEDIYIEEQLENGINLYDKDTEVLNNMVDLQL
ncbi:Nonsense-mediated mRNA decay protein, partial [Spraguea lophii 42_110]